ncbi:17417_t:CDS:2 [Entrophospora sp. SA101]|nr:17417_t:CDS:2 [Entrophospora sp. SA101]CAJ0827205.1 57_t:CDS:2 [Entrophospora sp. SA101]CAJ0827230.1 66_t:CDS:2 [Entrophospora sp. SA101]CAJ0827244.1 71_t:CDS:2 [Entrophospora sp. SA101]CAJ0901536.1 2762_t:CDS:2 [Entrophospora sp. SA101]
MPTIKETSKSHSKEEESLTSSSGESYRLMTRAGFIRQSSSGIYTLLPLALRSLEKIERIIDIELENIGAQKLSLPILLSSNGWKKTRRWESSGEELFRLKDRKKSEFCLAPTHEEEITQLIANEITSYRQLPLRLYQIGRKYRDEMRPRLGLLRGREFIMKDLYTFDTTEELALQTYQEVILAYKKIFEKIGIPFSIAKADSDFILSCSKCGYNENVDINNNFKEKINMLPNIHHGDYHNTSIGGGCPVCAKGDENNFVPLTVHRAIEVGHSFFLGTKYSEPLKATFAPQNPKVPGELLPIQMGCYGLGTSRMLAAIIESSHDKNGIIWPISVAPYRVCIIPGSDEPSIQNAELIGYPWVMVLGKKFLENGKIEIQVRQSKAKNYLSVQDLDKIQFQ